MVGATCHSTAWTKRRRRVAKANPRTGVVLRKSSILRRHLEVACDSCASNASYVGANHTASATSGVTRCGRSSSARRRAAARKQRVAAAWLQEQEGLSGVQVDTLVAPLITEVSQVPDVKRATLLAALQPFQGAARTWLAGARLGWS
jgi:hypothetical protein